MSTTNGAKIRYPYALAMAEAEQLVGCLAPSCERLVIAGSLRRQKPDAGDIEIVYIPKAGERRSRVDMFALERGYETDWEIERLLTLRVLSLRLNKAGNASFGPKNKLMRLVASGIPVDLFAATRENWFNYLVCRTGPKESNMRICQAAIARGWKWNPYGVGFSRGGPLTGETFREHAVTSEREVFEFVGLVYWEPEKRS